MKLDSFEVRARKAWRTTKLLAGGAGLVMDWSRNGVVEHNWGDKLNEWLARKITGLNVITHVSDVYPFHGRPVHYWIGSHLARACAEPNAVIWGSGCLTATVPLVGRPRRVCAARGWLSVERLKKAGMPVPEVVGDAALLMPRFYTPVRRLERRSLGIIPHCRETDIEFFRKAGAWEDARVIDICGKIEDVIEEIVACDRIVSSSLHGIICADAYGVPAIWIRASDRLLGDGFKFLDYFSSVRRPDTAPLTVTAETGRTALLDHFHDYGIDIDLDALWAACPAKSAAALS